MKISLARKIYPLLPECKKNIRWRSITDAELEYSKKEYQLLATCYEESVRHALCQTEKGRALLKKRIKISKDSEIEPDYKIILNIKGKDEIYRVDHCAYYGSHSKLYEEFYSGPLALLKEGAKLAPLNAGVAIAISKMIQKHPSLKPLISRLYLFPIANNRKCEHNLPSNAFRWFTGKEPIVIGETELSLNMIKHKENLTQLFDNYDSNKDCFVALTGNKKVQDIDKWHCLPIINVSKDNKTIELLNKRFNKKTTHSYEEIITKFKGIIGIRLD